MTQNNDQARRALELAARLAPYPELRARFEEILSVVENEQGDTFTADEAEERAFEQGPQTWARGFAKLGRAQTQAVSSGL